MCFLRGRSDGSALLRRQRYKFKEWWPTEEKNDLQSPRVLGGIQIVHVRFRHFSDICTFMSQQIFGLHFSLPHLFYQGHSQITSTTSWRLFGLWLLVDRSGLGWKVFFRFRLNNGCRRSGEALTDGFSCMFISYSKKTSGVINSLQLHITNLVVCNAFEQCKKKLWYVGYII